VFTVEDAFEVEGRVVKKRRGITFGKSIGALILFVVGYMVAVFLASRVQSILIRRFHMAVSSLKCNTVI
jgi:hypothetical protein